DHQGTFYQLGPFSTEDFRKRLLGRNLPGPVNETLTKSGLASKLDDIGRIINVPIFGVSDENIPIHYNEDEKMFPLGTFFRTTQNVNLNRFIPQNDDYRTFELTVPPNLGYPLPEGFGVKEKGQYPISYNSEKFNLITKGDRKAGQFPFNVVDSYKSLNFQKESSLGLIGGQELEKSIINKIAQIEDEANDNTPGTGHITPPIGDDGGVSSYVNRLRGSEQFFNTLPNGAVGWNEYNQSNGQPSGDQKEGVEPTLSTEIRVNTLLERTSPTQVSFLFDLLSQNTYKPLYEDRRLQGTSEEGTNANYYIGTEKSTNRGATIPKTFNDSDFNGSVDTSGNQKRTTVDENFFWSTGGESNFNEKTLLYKTQQLLNNNETEVWINQTKKYFKDKEQDRLISRGSAISPLAFIDAETNGNYCRVWTVNDNYNYRKAIRNTGLFTSSDTGVGQGFSATKPRSGLSVLMDNGIPKYHPVLSDSKTDRKKFMFSIENLAWADNLADLPLWEIGPGDRLSGNQGRMMWFPPYELTFDENTSANWTSTDFIGRSEPVYTYNNSKRSGQISFKVIVDHPRVINCYRGKSNDLIERFLSGCVTPKQFLSALECQQSQSSLEEIKKMLNKTDLQKSTDLESNGDTKDLPLDTPADCSDLGVSVDNCPKVPLTFNTSTLDSIITGDIIPFIQEMEGIDNKVKINCEAWLQSSAGINDKGEEIPRRFTKKITKNLAKEVYDYIIEKLKAQSLDKNVKRKISGMGVADTDEPVDNRVTILWENDSASKDSSQPKPNDTNRERLDNEVVERIRLAVDNLIIDESVYFDYIDATYPNYFDTISEKIKYFHPGFHSLTPEGLNTRLTFLNQCMRQGPSINNSGDDVQPQNLSFGRPPICIVRIGDFFHTKVAINSLSITYDGPQWDLNPEGIGVQPMIATVSLSVDLIGGHSLSGPINRLQNAVSFNYYANTEIYDVRSDKIVDGQLVPGAKLGQIKDDLKEKAEENESLKDEPTIDQEKDSEVSGGGNNPSESGKILDSNISGNNIVVFTVGDIAPSEIEIDGQTEAGSTIMVEWSVNDKIVGTDKSTTEATKIEIDLKGVYAVSLQSPEELKRLNTIIEEKKVLLSNVVTNMMNNNGSPKDVEEAVAQLAAAEEELAEYKVKYKDTITINAYLSIFNKTSSNINKTFTVTEDGLT
ncbi:MAG: hypothetical protein ACXADW_10990, partial [Candidatus Hodarchaeales archaeon]